MGEQFEVQWEGELAGTPEQVWDAVTRQTSAWLWPVEYEPRLGGVERGLGSEPGAVTAWEPARHFATQAGVNALDYVFEPRGERTYVHYVHRGVLSEDGDGGRVELDACRRHTAFYYHSLGEYVAHFAGREAVYVSVEAPEASANGGHATLRAALGIPADVAPGDRVALTPAGMDPIEGVVDYSTPAFLGVRTDDALIRVYGRDVWGWPVEVALHLFADNADAAAAEQAWSSFLADVFTTTEAVA